MDDKYARQLTEEYRQHHRRYENFTFDLFELLRKLIDNAGIDYSGFEYRTKTIESFSEKIERPDKAQKYSTLSDITDLSGIRVIAYMREDVEKICSLIKLNFQIDEKNSANREEIIDPDRFGYLSYHYVVSYTAERLKLPDFAMFSDLKAEIQVRTILQHTWAAIDWKLRYKSDQEVPRELRRRLYRISALLEAADEDFSTIGRDLDVLKKEYEQSFKKREYDIGVDRESLEIFMRDSRAVREIEKIAAKNGYSISPPPTNSRNPLLSLLLTIKACRIETLADIESILSDKNQSEQNLALVYGLWKRPGMPNRLALDLAGIVRVLLILHCEKNFGRDVLNEYPFGPSLQDALIAALT